MLYHGTDLNSGKKIVRYGLKIGFKRTDWRHGCESGLGIYLTNSPQHAMMFACGENSLSRGTTGIVLGVDLDINDHGMRMDEDALWNPGAREFRSEEHEHYMLLHYPNFVEKYRALVPGFRTPEKVKLLQISLIDNFDVKPVDDEMFTLEDEAFGLGVRYVMNIPKSKILISWVVNSDETSKVYSSTVGNLKFPVGV